MKESKGYYRYKGALGGVFLGLIFSFVITFALGSLNWILPLILVLTVLGAILGACFPKYFAWAWHLIPSGDD